MVHVRVHHARAIHDLPMAGFTDEDIDKAAMALHDLLHQIKANRVVEQVTVDKSGFLAVDDIVAGEVQSIKIEHGAEIAEAICPKCKIPMEKNTIRSGDEVVIRDMFHCFSCGYGFIAEQKRT